MTVYEKNIAFLCTKFPAFRRDILENHRPDDTIEGMTTPSGHRTAKLRGLFLHSGYDPLQEARRLASGSIQGNEDCIILEGFGLGYSAEAVIDLAPGIPLIIVESDPAVFLGVLAQRPVEHIFSRDNVSLLVAVEGPALVQILSNAQYAVIKVIRHRTLSLLYGEYYDRIEEAVSSYLARKDINRNTLKRFAGVWVKNLTRNLPMMVRARGTETLGGVFSGIPALLLAAGPTVDEIIPHLKDLRRRFLIAAVDTCARLLSDAGIEPDILVVVDPQYWNTRYLDGMGFRNSLLVSESSTHPRVFRLLDLPVFFGASIFPLGRFLERFTDIAGELGAGGSVATSAWDVLRLTGCREIYCAGLDLGFPDMKTHYRGCLFETRNLIAGRRLIPAEQGAFHALHDADPFPEDNLDGGKTLTDRRLVVYKWWFENQLRMYPSVKTSSLSRFGIRIEGMTHAPVSRLFEYPDIREELDRRVLTLAEKTPPAAGNREKLLVGIEELIRALSALADLADRGRTSARSAESKRGLGEDISRDLATLDALDEAILSSDTKDLAGFLMQDFIHEVTASEKTGKSRNALETSEVMYGRLKEAAVYHGNLLREAAERFRG